MAIRRQKGNAPADGKLVAERNEWQIYARDTSDKIMKLRRATAEELGKRKPGRIHIPQVGPVETWPWRPFKVIKAGREPGKANYHLLWNGVRLAGGSETETLKRFQPDVYDWVIKTLSKQYPRVRGAVK